MDFLGGNNVVQVHFFIGGNLFVCVGVVEIAVFLLIAIISVSFYVLRISVVFVGIVCPAVLIVLLVAFAFVIVGFVADIVYGIDVSAVPVGNQKI